MSEIRSDIDRLQQRIKKSKAPAIDYGVQILPVSHNEFQARWSLSQESLDAGLRAASRSKEEAYLVLRAYCLPIDADRTDFSSVWHDYSIDGTENSGYFTLPSPVPKINAAVGVMSKSGRFSPLVQGDAVTLPAAPAPPSIKTATEPEASKSQPVEDNKSAGDPDKGGEPAVSLNEAEITERLERISGLPQSFRSRPDPLSTPSTPSKAGDSKQKHSEKTISGTASNEALAEHTPPQVIDETETIETVRHKMALDPEPAITDRPSDSSSLTEPSIGSGNTDNEDGASEQLASQWEDIWSDNTPIEIRAEYVLTGKIAHGMKLLLGNEIVEPGPGGFIVWKRKLNAFNQIWPLLNAALSTPSVAAGPSMQFFKDVKSADRILELYAALEIEGKVTDPNYQSILPDDLHLNPDGTFKLNRMLPDGAVILPGLSLIAG